MIECTEVRPDTVGDLKREYPYIGESAGCIVLFVDADTGINLQASVGEDLSDDHKGWYELAFRVSTAAIVLQNKLTYA